MATTADQNRAALGLGILLGAFAGLVSEAALLPLLGWPSGFLGAGIVGALPTIALMAPRIGGARAAALAAALAGALAATFWAAGFLAWILSG
jgi:hypothetical protein